MSDKRTQDNRSENDAIERQDAIPVTPGETEPSKKRRRRILSCDACRRLKCRCELEYGSDTCSRCRNLRIPCLKSGSLDQSYGTQETNTQQDLIKSLHEKVLNLENSMQDMRSQLAKLQPQKESTAHHGNQQSISFEKPANDRVLVDEIEPADQHVHASPAEVIRRVACQVTGNYRRAFYTREDVVSTGMLSAPTAESLVKSFIHRRRHVLLINNESDLVTRGTLLHTSPFLHAVCCTHEMRYTHTNQTDALKHRQVYEHARTMLGQVMLGSPLPLEEITGVLITALFAGSPSREAEYVDSWLLSGHCAQQAMLCIQFSDILQRTNAGTSTMLDLRSMRLWANVCLVHLHWSATTGRPSILPGSYLSQCRNLLNFEQTTMRDAMLFAEVCLYSILQQDFCGKLNFASDGSCEKFANWKQKWGHLMELPTGLTLKLSYHIANMILAKRSLDQVEAHALNSASSVSPQIPQAVTTDSQDISTKYLQDRVYDLSFRVTAAFVLIPSSSSGDLPEFHSLCISYSMLILSQFEELPSSIPRHELLVALAEVKRRCNESNAYSIAVRFSVERAWERLRMDSHNLSTVEPTGLESQFNSPVGLAQNTNKSNQNTMSGSQVGGDSQALQQGGTVNPVGSGMESLENMDFFFNGGYLDILDIDNFLL